MTGFILAQSCSKTKEVTPVPPTVEIAAVSELTINSARFNGQISNSGNQDISDYGFVYSESNAAPTLSDAKVSHGAVSQGTPTPVTISDQIQSLKTGTTYNVRAYAVIASGPVYSSSVSFKTSDLVQGTLSTDGSTGVTIFTAKLQATIKSKGTYTISEYGICWSASNANPTTSDPKGTISGSPVSFPAAFSVDATNLIANTSYNFRAYFISNGITTYGNTLSFKTSPLPILINFWKKLNDFGGSARFGAIAFSIGTKGYLGLGTTVGYGTIFKDLWEYNPDNDVWTQKADYAGGTMCYGIAYAANFKGYVGLGYTSKTETRTPSMYEYNPLSNVWTQKNPVRRGNGGIAESGYFGIGNKVYTVGGNGTDGKECWSYDTGTDTWAQEKSLPGIARKNPAGLAIDNKGMIVGGYDGNNVLGDVWSFDPASRAVWNQESNFPGGARTGAIGFGIDGKGYVGTGLKSTGEFLSDFYEYDMSKATWTKKADFSEGRAVAAGFVLNKKIYVGTGLNNAVRKDWYIYNP